MATKTYYKESAIEPILLMATLLTENEFKGFIKGNMIKYSLRAPYKGQQESDTYKARWYSALLDYLQQDDAYEGTVSITRRFMKKVELGEVKI